MKNYRSQEILKYFLAKERAEPYQEVADNQIDYSDIPELTATQIKKAKRARVGRPPLGMAPRQMISIKLDPFLLATLKRKAKKQGMKYQSLIHSILEQYAKEK